MLKDDHSSFITLGLYLLNISWLTGISDRLQVAQEEESEAVNPHSTHLIN
jgi:hypothetical protein